MKKLTGYFGGKMGNGVYQTLINQIPPHYRMISCFMGYEALFQKMKPAPRRIGIELNKNTIDDWLNSNYPAVVAKNGVPSAENEISIINKSFFDLPDDFYNRSNTFVFIDAPYLHSTRKSNTRYDYELTDLQHVQILKRVNTWNNCFVMITHYPCFLYDAYLQDWRSKEYQFILRNGELETDCIYMNYDKPEELHDYRYIGENNRQREVYNRRLNNFIKKFNRFTKYEQQRIIQKLNS